jgi:hypothetical protein
MSPQVVLEMGMRPRVWCRDCLPVTPAIDLPPVQTAPNGAQAPRRIELPNVECGLRYCHSQFGSDHATSR